MWSEESKGGAEQSRAEERRGGERGSKLDGCRDAYPFLR